LAAAGDFRVFLDIHHAPPARKTTSATAMIAIGFLSSMKC
jgi:hypothetical protein